jgi:hypothetical protein
MWEKLKVVYTRELSLIAFSDIPKEEKIFDAFIRLIKIIADIDKC